MTSGRVDFFVCGAQKAGTTLLHEVLARHDSVDMGLRKEINFFSFQYACGTAWYHEHYPFLEERLAGDVSPSYMLKGEQIAPRILEYNPAARFVFILRDPVRRAWSHYWHNRKKGNEPFEFTEAIVQEEARLRACPAEMMEYGPELKAYHTYSYILRSRYATLLQPFFAIVPRSQILVLLLESLRRESADALTTLSDFLGLPSGAPLAEGNVETVVKAGGIPRFPRLQHWLYRNKRFFQATRLMSLWGMVNRANMAWGRPYPEMEPDARHLVDERLAADRLELIALLEWEQDPWPQEERKTVCAGK